MTGTVPDREPLPGNVLFREGMPSMVREGKVREGKVREGILREGMVREGILREGMVREGMVREGMVREGGNASRGKDFRDFEADPRPPTKGFGWIRSGSYAGTAASAV